MALRAGAACHADNHGIVFFEFPTPDFRPGSVGDAELDEGSNHEAIAFAGRAGLDSLVCVAVDNVCPKQGPKACGCDGTTYANECELLKAGVRQVRKGDCGPDSKGAKVCSNNPDCTGTGELCELPAGTCGGTGRCIVAPDVCQNVLAPVCGCDNKTYRNDCERRRAGVSLKAAGECTGAGS